MHAILNTSVVSFSSRESVLSCSKIPLDVSNSRNPWTLPAFIRLLLVVYAPILPLSTPTEPALRADRR